MSELPAWGTTPILVGDHIENEGNASCLRAAAAMFEWSCGFIGDSVAADGALRLSSNALARSGVPIIAVENTSGAEDLFKYRPPDGPFAVIVGNERKGVSRELLRLADRVIQIPIQSVQLNCLNVAAAASVALYRLARQGRQIATRGGHRGGRPSVMLARVDDPIELGSAVRSAACFGWKEVCVADRHDVWFDADRVVRSLGRGAARRARNPIRVVPIPADAAFDEVCVIGTGAGEPLRHADLARGPQQLVVLGDADAVDVCRLAPRVHRIQLEVEPGAHPFRLVASIALAEIARQVG
ncbi:MAG TPA: TrmH family RNA methyltransferase [Kofleriaceae bacterium]|nr:TrmH family RNA methyltransferase [Kofleriaceae bacterium]